MGDEGSVLVWSAFEQSTLKTFVNEQEKFGEVDTDLSDWIHTLVSTRFVDLLAWAKEDFFHPSMAGKAGLKYVLDGLWKADPAMRAQCSAWLGRLMSDVVGPYEALPSIVINGVEQDCREGTGAVRAYEEMMYGCGQGDEETRANWSQLLREYCKLDTLSMVLVFEHWRRITCSAGVQAPPSVVSDAARIAEST